MKQKVCKFWKYVIAALLPVVCIVIHMAIDRCYPFGNNTILLGDANGQYYAFFNELSDKIRDGGSLLFSIDKGLGYDFYSNFFYYLASPFNLIALVLGRTDMEIGMIVTMCVQVGICGASMTYYLSHSFRNKMEHGRINDAVCIVLGLAYSMCDYIVAYQYNMMWLISFILAPFIMLGVENMVRGGDRRLYFAAMVMAFVFNFYFSWFLAILAVVWFIDVQEYGWREFWRSGLRFASTSVVAAFCSCFVLVPCFLAIMQRHTEKDMTIITNGTVLNNIADYIQSFFWGNEVNISGSELYGRNSYVGIFVIFLAVTYIGSKRTGRYVKLKRIIEIAILMICCNSRNAIYILHGMTYPHSFSCRFAFTLVLLLVVTAFEGIVHIEKQIYVYLILSVLFFAMVFVFTLSYTTEVQVLACYMATVMILVYLILVAVLYNRGSIKRESFIVNILIIGVLELLSNNIYVSMHNYDISKDRSTGTVHWENIYNNIDDSRLDRKTSWIMSANNMSYSDTNLFSSVINGDLWRLFGKTGLVYQTNSGSYAYRGATPVTSLMFNVRNVLTDNKTYFGGYTKENSYLMFDGDYNISDEYGLYTTDSVVGLGVAVSEDILNWDLSNRDVFEVQNDFIHSISGYDGVFSHVGIDEMDNMKVQYRACVADRTYSPADVLENSGQLYRYMNISLDPDYHSTVKFYFQVPRDMELYVYMYDKNQLCTRTYIDGKQIGSSATYPAPAETLYLGFLKAGQKVEIDAVNRAGQLTKGATYIDFYEYDDQMMKRCIEDIRDSAMVVDVLKDTYIKGNVNAHEDGVLYTSIPYYKGFSAYVDGEKKNTLEIAGGALLGIYIPEGEHTVEVRYFPYGLKAGILLSVAGMLCAGVYIKRAGRRSREHGEEK